MENGIKLLFNEEVRTIDLPVIAEVFGNDVAGLQECDLMIQNELVRVKKKPDTMGKECEYEPLRSAGWRKVKLFSSKALQTTKGATPDLRIIYKFDEANNMVIVHSIGFRLKERPRPDNDPYSRAEQRLLNR